MHVCADGHIRVRVYMDVGWFHVIIRVKRGGHHPPLVWLEKVTHFKLLVYISVFIQNGLNSYIIVLNYRIYFKKHIKGMDPPYVVPLCPIRSAVLLCVPLCVISYAKVKGLLVFFFLNTP